MSKGIKLSKLNAKLSNVIDMRPLIGKMRQNGFVKIIYDPSQDEEPLVQLTEKGREQAIELLHALQEAE